MFGAIDNFEGAYDVRAAPASSGHVLQKSLSAESDVIGGQRRTV
jgi:hypothetical protein